MGISATGQAGLSMRAVRSMLVVIFVLLGTFYYFYGPLITPRIQEAALAACNEHAGGNFRSYRLEWVSWPETDPHWSFWDARKPAQRPISLGWWVTPRST